MTQTQTETVASPTLEQRLMDRFASETQSFPNPERQRRALESFLGLGFPKAKSEKYKYSPFRNFTLAHDLVRQAVPTLTVAGLEALALPEMDGLVVVMVNGRWVSALSNIDQIPKGLYLQPLNEAIESGHEAAIRHFGQVAKSEEDAFVALNTAFLSDGLFVHVGAGKMIEPVLHILNLTQNEADATVQPRLLVVAESGASIRIVESRLSLSQAAVFSNVVSEWYVGEKANVSYHLLQDSGETSTEHHTLSSVQEADSVFTTHVLTLSGHVVRNNQNYLPNAEFCETNLNAVVVANGQMHVDNATFVDHALPNGTSNESYKHILGGKSTGVFNGKIMVRQDAQKTNAYQSNKTILTSDEARIYTKPELEIYADDVKCSHGAATGKMDEEVLFYLRARGLSASAARKMLLIAFAGDVTGKISLDALRKDWNERITERL
ncbi:MAG TPA: Fe-S cluster assembly protein SufD [Rhodothermales bacterium]|nr:Fe-S cluster assembly protein SufD [Rhodothermales bacterium]HRR09643.1 Fe-S cluster assembly protein SufD [Rhodothermales bacterium]